MTAARLEGEAYRNPNLDRYRRGAAEVRDGGIVVGTLLTRVQEWWTLTGPARRRRGVDPVERPEWLLIVAPGLEPSFGGRTHVDGVESDLAEVLREWGANRFALSGVGYELTWLTGADLEKVWVGSGWE